MLERATLSLGTTSTTSNVALNAGSSQQGRALRASADWNKTCACSSKHAYTTFPWILPILELFPHWLSGSSWTKQTHCWIVPAPCTCMIILVGMAQYVHLLDCTSSTLITVKLLKYDHSTIQYSWIRSICHDHSQTSCSFGLNAVHMRAQKCCNINCTRPSFIPTLKLYLHVSILWN